MPSQQNIDKEQAMAEFKFNLQKVLDYRKQLEDQAALALAQAKMEETRVRNILTDLQNQIAQQREALSNPATLSSGEFWLRKTYQETLGYQVVSTKKQIALCQEQVNFCQEYLASKAKDHALLCKLKEKQAKNHATQERLSEQRVYDETATMRHKAFSF